MRHTRQPFRFRSFAAANPRQDAAYFLGMAAEYGLGPGGLFWVPGQQWMREAIMGQVSERLAQVGEAYLLADPDFLLALRLGIVRVADRALGNWREEFLAQLQEVFPKDFAERLNDVAIRKLREDRDASRDIVPKLPVVVALEKRRNAVFTAGTG